MKNYSKSSDVICECSLSDNNLEVVLEIQSLSLGVPTFEIEFMGVPYPVIETFMGKGSSKNNVASFSPGFFQICKDQMRGHVAESFKTTKAITEKEATKEESKIL